MNPQARYVTLMVTALVLALALPLLIRAPGATAGNGNGKGNGNTGDVGGDVSGVVFIEVEFDDDYRGNPADGANTLVSDGLGLYVDGVDRVNAGVGRNRAIVVDLNDHKSKPAIRTLVFPLGHSTILPVSAECAPMHASEEITAPTGPGPSVAGVIPDAELHIRGEDHDDTPVGCRRYVNAHLKFKDDNGETWFIHFGSRANSGGSFYAPCGSCVAVERLANVDSDEDGQPDDPGISRWEFFTEPTADGHIGYLFRDNRPPHSPTEFWGAVEVSFSGVIHSLTDEEVPPAAVCSEVFPDTEGCPPPASP